MHRQSACQSRPSLLKRKRQNVECEDIENINTSNHHSANNVEKRASLYKSSSKHDYPDQPSSPLSSPLTPRDIFTDQSLNRYLGESCSPSSRISRNIPLPTLPWANKDHLWEIMCMKDRDVTTQRNPRMFEHHTGIKPRMRSILLDWIIEVCEVYKMHRETYYLAVDYLDRYLSIQRGVVKSQLQLIGITCLFIASKVEEIYPPKLSEFAYVTDGACQTEQILDQELVVLKTLDWNLSSMTVLSWLNLFIQICHVRSNTSSTNQSFVFPNHPIKEFVQSAQLLDLAVLDENSLKYSYSVLAATSMYLTSFKDQIISASGLQWVDIADCVDWMGAFAQSLREEKSPHSPVRIAATSNGSAPEESYLIQAHSVDLSVLDKAQAKLSNKTNDLTSPAHHSSIILLTPPSSSKKPQN